MKKTKKLLAVFMVFALSFTNFIFSKISIKADTNTPTASQSYAAAMGPGWNLGNTFDGFDTGKSVDPGETSWGNPVVTKELIDTIKAQGFKSIRMPFTTVTRTGAAPDYIISPTYLARYAQVVQWALDDGLYVMINIHHDSWNWAPAIDASWDNGTSMQKYKALWTQLANYFKDYSDKVCFESLNEPQFWTGDTANQIKILEDVNTQFYNVVRNSGGKNATRMLVMPTLNTNDSDDRCDSLYNTITKLNDPNIIATIHYYGYWPFSTNIAGVTTMNDTVVSEIKGAFDRVYNHFVSKGIGVVCGEYGLLGFDKSVDAIEHGEVLKYFDYVNYYAQLKGITMMLWDNGQHMNRKTYTWNDQSLYNVIKASWTSRSSYTASDRIFIQDQNKNNDIKIPVTLNGNTLSSIYNGNQQLILGLDYTYEDNTVTLSGDYVSSLITNIYGTNATLTMRFSAGADWKIDLIHYTTPVLSSAKGTTSGIAIPVQFNGAKLSTLEAASYADGKGAGPQNWTTYKEYDSAFTVDYSANTVTLTDKFFNEVSNDGEILLKLHFQSGEVMEYRIFKSGTNVTGEVPTAKITADNKNVILERDFAANFTISMNQLVKSNAFDITVKYDSNSYDIANIQYLVPGLTTISVSDSDGTLRLIFGKTDNKTITANDYTDLVKLTLVPKSPQVSQSATVQLVKANTSILYTNTGKNDITADAAYVLGQSTDSSIIQLGSDINKDGKVTLADLSMALAYYMDDKDSINWSDVKIADVNGDGVIDIVDLQLITGFIK